MVDVVIKKRGSTAELPLTGRIDSNTTMELEKYCWNRGSNLSR